MTDEVWHVDFEYSTHEDGSLKEPFLLAAYRHADGKTIILWDDQLRRRAPPFPVTDRTLVVCHHCVAEHNRFARLGWPKPNFIDTLV